MKKSIKKEIKEWLIFLGIIVAFYFFGGHILLQQLILATGFILPNTEVPENEQAMADYDFTLVDLKGNEVPFSVFKDKVVFMNIWATWCPPCRAEMPDIDRLFKEVASNKIVFVMISVDENPSAVEKYLAKKDYHFPVYYLRSALPQVFSASSIPRTYIISPKGKIASQKEGMANYNNPVFKKFLKDLSR